MGISAGPSGVSDGLVFQLDAANLRSYSGSGLTSNGLVGGIGGTLVNGTGFSSANNGSFFFDGTNDYISLPNPNLLAFGTNSFSIDFWLYSTYVYPGSGVLYRTILSSYDNYNGDYNTYFYLGLFNFAGYGLTNTVGLLDSTGNYFNASFGVNISINEWTYVAFTRSGNNLICYKNGSFFASESRANNFSGTRNARIGGGVDQVNTFQGSISSMKIYNRPLSATEIQQNFNALRERYNL